MVEVIKNTELAMGQVKYGPIRKGRDKLATVRTVVIESIHRPAGVSGLLSFLYLVIGATLFLIARWLDPGCSVKVLVTVCEVHFIIGTGLYVFALFTRNNGLAIILSILVLYGALLLGHSIALYGLMGIFALFVAQRVRFCHKIDWRKFLPSIAVLCGSGFMFALLSVVSSERICDFLIETKMMHKVVSPDTFFHAAIVSMLREYGQISLGLHGYETGISSHVFFHQILAAISSLHNISSLSSFGYVYVINLAPLVFVAILACAEDAFPSRDSSRFCIRSVLLVLLLGGLAMFPRLISLYVIDNYLQSQSYNLGLTFLLASVSCAFARHFPQRVYGMGIGVVLASLAKISTGAVGVCLYLFEIWRCRASMRWKDLVFCGGVCVTVGWLMLGMVRGTQHVHAGGLSFVLMHHLTYYMQLPANWISIPYFMAGHFAFSWIALCCCVWAIWFGPVLERGKWEFFLFANLMGIGVGTLAVSFFKATGASFFYFSNISMFLALPVILVLWFRTYAVWDRKRLLHWLVPITTSVLLSVVCLIGVRSHGVPAITGAIERMQDDAKNMKMPTEMGHFLAKLKEIGRRAHNGRFLVYIPKKEQSFWKPEGMHPQFAGFYVPAIAGAPALFGLPHSTDINAMNLWGLGDYPHEIALKGDADYLSDALLRAETERMGYDAYVIVERGRTTWHRVRGD